MKDLSSHEKKIAAAKNSRPYSHLNFAFLKKDKDVFNILEIYSNSCSVCKRFKPTLPKPAADNLFDPDKMKLNQAVSIDLKQYKSK